ncbi:hypothetical protein AAG906_020245 [Vitis piasezkii]
MLPAIQNPSLTAFKPRSVMLSNQAMNNLSNKTSKTLNPCQKKTLLHSSILHYLQRSGFSKTLKYFQREAPLENDNGNGCSLDLEEVYYKSLETCDNASTNWNNCKEQDLEKSDKKDGEDNCVAVVETVSKKKKKRSEESNRKAVVNESGTANKFCNAKNSEKTLTKDIVPPLNVKSKEKKSKKIYDPLDEGTEQVSSEISKEPVDETVCEPQLDESSKKGKDKKKKSKLVSQPHVDNAEPHQLDTQPGENEENPKGLAAAEGREATDSEANIKSKDKKKKKLEKEKSKRTDSKSSNSQTVEEDALDEDDKVSKKRKRLACEESNSQPADKVVVEESKRQKTESSKESDGIKLLKEVKESLGSDLDEGDKGKVALNKSQETPIKQLDVQANGILDKNGEKSTAETSEKSPKTVNAFQRVKIDEVEFADQRLQDNSYWAKGGADSGYGAKAQEILGQVRGRDFRHEKTKKKRGSYRGGQIDLQTHSVKFNYSDDD